MSERSKAIREALQALRLVGLTDPEDFHTTEDNMRGRQEAHRRCIRVVAELLRCRWCDAEHDGGPENCLDGKS